MTSRWSVGVNVQCKQVNFCDERCLCILGSLVLMSDAWGAEWICSCNGLFLDTGFGTSVFKYFLMGLAVINLRREIKSRHISFAFLSGKTCHQAYQDCVGVVRRLLVQMLPPAHWCATVWHQPLSNWPPPTLKPTPKVEQQPLVWIECGSLKPQQENGFSGPSEVKLNVISASQKGKEKKHPLFVSLTLRQRWGHMIAGSESDPFLNSPAEPRYVLKL